MGPASLERVAAVLIRSQQSAIENPKTELF